MHFESEKKKEIIVNFLNTVLLFTDHVLKEMYYIKTSGLLLVVVFYCFFFFLK